VHDSAVAMVRFFFFNSFEILLFPSYLQKIMPGIRPVTTEELKKINRNIEERVTDIRASTVSSDDEIPDFSLELNDDSKTEKGKIWLPEPFGPQEVESLEETTYVVNAFLREAMPDLVETLNNITIIECSGKRYKVIPSVNVIELKSFLKMKNFLAIKMNAFTVLSRHFEKKAFDICPDCQEVQMDRTLSCYKCGYTRKLNQGTDKL